MVDKRKQSVIIQCAQRFLQLLCLILPVEVSEVSPKHVYREGIN